MRTNSLKMETDNDQTKSEFHLTLKEILSSLARNMFCSAAKHVDITQRSLG